jgi:hypothetical protein
MGENIAGSYVNYYAKQMKFEFQLRQYNYLSLEWTAGWVNPVG